MGTQWLGLGFKSLLQLTPWYAQLQDACNVYYNSSTPPGGAWMNRPRPRCKLDKLASQLHFAEKCVICNEAICMCIYVCHNSKFIRVMCRGGRGS